MCRFEFPGGVTWRWAILLFSLSQYACASNSTVSPLPDEAKTSAAPERPNILVITVDDMNADSVGVFGSQVPAITPHIDALAKQGIRFENAHVQVANCMPSRNVMWSGRYPHSNGVEGFLPVAQPGYPTLGDVLRSEGYFTAIRHKLKDSTPYTPFPWDRVLDDHAPGGRPHRKDARSYGLSVTDGIASARAANKPFFLLINVADPHLPFFGLDKKGHPVEDPHIPSRIYQASDVEVPGFLPDHPVVREELAHYFSSVRRADDAVGAILEALAHSGQADNTLVMFVSDHGMPFPFAKTQLYHRSTHTPLILRWPRGMGVGTVDSSHLVSAVDFMPTLLEAAGAPLPDGLQGYSFLDLLVEQAPRDSDSAPPARPEYVIKEYNQNSGWQRAPMRAVQSERYLYVFNPWSNGKRTLKSATLKTRTYQTMEALSATDEAMAARIHHLRHRSVEEFYDLQSDPDCLHNLVDEAAVRVALERHRSWLGQWMQRTEDHAQAAFAGRSDRAALDAYMAAQNKAVAEQAKWYKGIRDAMRKNRKNPG